MREDLQQSNQQQQHHAPHIVMPEASMMNNPRFLQPTKTTWTQECPMTSTLVTPSTSAAEITADFTNRARIVSDDSVGTGFFQGLVDQPASSGDSCGSKRSREEPPVCSMQEQQEQGNRGPRLKLIKSRMEYCM